MKKRILFIISSPTHPTFAGNRIRNLRLIESIIARGHDLHIAHIEKYKGDTEEMKRTWGNHYHPITYVKPPRRETLLDRYKRRVKSLYNVDTRYTVGIDDWYDSSADQKLKDLHSKYNFEVVIVQYVFMSRAFNLFGKNVLKILDTHDKFANRHRIFLEKGTIPTWFSTSPDEEHLGFSRCDTALAIQKNEEVFYREKYKCNTITVGHILDVKGLFSIHAETPQSLLFIGSNNTPNIDGITHFYNDIFPLIKQKNSSIRILIAGNVCEAIPDFEGIEKLGVVDDLRNIYSQGCLIINPVTYGTGLNIKTIEALGYGQPLITTSKGILGLPASDKKYCITADNSVDFANEVINTLQDKKLQLELSKNALALAKSWNAQQEKALNSALNPAHSAIQESTLT